MEYAYCRPTGHVEVTELAFHLLDKRAEETPTKEAFVFRPDEIERVSFTFEGVRDATECLAVWFLRLGLRTGDRVGILSQNRPEFLLCELAGARIGLVLVRLYATMDSKLEITRTLSATKCKLIITQNQSLHSVLAIAQNSQISDEKLSIPELPDLEKIVSFKKSESPGVLFLPEHDSIHPTNDELSNLRKIQNSLKLTDDCTIFGTSGSTGIPKLIIHSHRHTIGHLLGMLERCGIQREDVYFVDRPMAHGVGSIYVSLYYGVTQVIANPWMTLKPGENYLNSIFKQEKVTCGMTFPYALYDITQNQDLIFYKDIRFVIVSGQIANREILRKVNEKLDINIINVYGTTETGCLASCHHGDGIDTVATYVGTPVKVDMKVIHENGETVKIGEEGQLAVQSNGDWRYLDENIMEKSHLNGFWLTGDNARMETNGYIQILGRRDDVISVGTVKVYPAPIELKICELDNVDKAVVFGVPDVRLREVIGAAILRRQGTSLSPDDVIEHFRSGISGSDLMTGVAMAPKFVWIEEEFPKNASGKIDIKRLKNICLAKLQSFEESK